MKVILMTFDGLENQIIYMYRMFRFKEQRNIARLNFLCIEVYRETQSYNKDSKNHFGQFKENISEQSLPKNIFIIKKFKRFSF